MTATQTTIAAAQPVAARSVPSLVAVVVLVLLVFTLRLPSLAEPHHYTDEGIFAATAQRLLDGEALYRGAWDDKPPLVYLVYAAVLALAGPSMVALRLVGVACSAATALVVLGIGRRVGGERTGWLAALLYAVLAALPFIEGTPLLTESLMVLPAALAMLFVLDAADRSGTARDWRLVGAGALLGTAFLFKQVAALDATAAGIWLLCGRSRPLKDAMLLTVGWAAPIAATVLWLAASGLLAEAWHGVFGFYGTYLQEGSAVPAGFKVLRLLPAGVALGWVLWRRRTGTVAARDLSLLWLGVALIGATLAARPFGHYLVQVLAPFAVVVADLTPRPPSLAGKGVP
ncbi:MAG: ArnT family glycosyltransferase, partial [Dehalococcoidia bacterium]